MTIRGGIWSHKRCNLVTTKYSFVHGLKNISLWEVWVQKLREYTFRGTEGAENWKEVGTSEFECEACFFAEGWGRGTFFISSLRRSSKRINSRLGENSVAWFYQNILLFVGLGILPIKYFFNPQGSARIDSWIRLLLTVQVLI